MSCRRRCAMPAASMSLRCPEGGVKEAAKPFRLSSSPRLQAPGRWAFGERPFEASMDIEAIRPHLSAAIREISLPNLPNHYSGKVRENYDLPDGRRVLVATDRISAFD